jgi:hypothetical protein
MAFDKRLLKPPGRLRCSRTVTRLMPDVRWTLNRRRLDAQVAVDTLNTSVNPIRKRIQCGTLESEREEGWVYGWPDDDQDTGGTVESGTLIFAKDNIVAELRERVASLERQLETRSEKVWRKDHIIAAEAAHSRAIGRSSPGESSGHREKCWRGKRLDPSVEALRTPVLAGRALGAGGKEFSVTARKVGGGSLDLRPMDLHHEG